MSSARLMLRLRHLVEAVAGVIGVLLIRELVGRLAANATLVPPPATVWRAASPQEMAGAALLLCSEAGSFVTGADLQATGGAHL